MALLIKSQRYIVVCEARLIGSCLNLCYRWISSISQSNGRVENWRTCWYLPFSVRFCLFTTTNYGFKNYAAQVQFLGSCLHFLFFVACVHINSKQCEGLKLLFWKVIKFNDTFINGVYFICFTAIFRHTIPTLNIPNTEPSRYETTYHHNSLCDLCKLYHLFLPFTYCFFLLPADELFLEAYTEIII